MSLATVAAVFWALGSALVGLAYAVLSVPGSFSATDNLLTAGAWLRLCAGLVVLAAVCIVGWRALVSRNWPSTWELAGAALSTLLLCIGLLAAATQATDVPASADVISAIGVGGWAALVVVCAARRALDEQDLPPAQHQAGLRLAGAGAVALVAIGVGLPSPSLEDSTLAVATAVITLAGFALLASVLSVARGRRFVLTVGFPVVTLGLWVLALDALARAVCNGIVFGPPPHSLVSVRVGLSLPDFLEAIGFVVLAWACFRRVGELSRKAASMDHGAPAPVPTFLTQAVPPSWQADPSGRHELRWWDGLRWTENVADAGRQSVETDQPGGSR